ncbi:MAG: TonB-dependent receptor plug domain-containing protein, partial [Cyclobacteriaceae bacterium]
MQKIYLVTAVLLFLGWNAFAQRSVSGKVTDPNGEALVGVNVLERGTSNGTITDISGNFTVEVQDNATLVFSFIGYTSISEAVGSRSVINITLQEDVTQLSEIVVSALGFEQNKDKLGSTSSVINTDDMVRSGEANLINGLGGKAAGVSVARSNGDPGAGSNIQIRGINTIGGDAQPLIIVDGIPINNSSENGFSGNSSGATSQQSRLNDINPQDVASVQVLKGASAAALWGSRAANGVIVITTKKGKSGDKVNISYSATYSSDEINKKFPTQTTFGQGTGGRFVLNRNNAWGDKISERAGGPDTVDPNSPIYFEGLDGTKYFPIANGDAVNPHGGKNSRELFDQSNFDQVFQRGHFFENNLSISGGNDKGTFYFGMGDLKQEGIIRTSDYRRTTLRLNNEYFFNDWISMSSKATYAKTSSNRVQQS